MRPSWQIDLKWMLGLAACLLVVVSGVVYSLSDLTRRETAIPVASALVSAGINDRVSDEEYSQIQAAAVGSPSSNVTLSPISLSFTGGEIVGLDKESAAAVVGSKVAGVMYDNGGDAAKSLIVTPPPETGKEAVSLGPVGALTASNHNLFTEMFIGLTSLALVMLGGVAILGRGWGRLGAPSFIVAIGSAPLALIWVGASSAAGPGDAGESRFIHAARESFNGAASDLSTVFVGITAIALASGVLCVIGSALSMMVGDGEKTGEIATVEADPTPAASLQPAVATVQVRQAAVPEPKPGQVPGIPQIAKKPEPSASKQQVA